MRSRRVVLIVLAIVVVVVVVGGVYTVFFASKPSPTTSKAPGPAAACPTPAATTGMRSFNIVPAQTTASYKVHENLILHNLPSTDAVGKTHDVSGTFRITTKAPLVAALNVTVNLSTLQTDEPMRDRYVRERALETSSNPNATFALTCTQGMPASYSDGQTIAFKMLGNLTMHGKTNQETFAVTGKVAGNMVTGTATTSILMSDFGIDPPNLENIAKAENKVLITLNFTAKEG